MAIGVGVPRAHTGARAGGLASARRVLRAATATDHRRLDLVVSASRPFATRASYRDFLSRHLEAQAAVADRFGGLAPDDSWTDRIRRRDDALALDLADLHCDVVHAVHSSATQPSAGWGVLYVLEGSVLGGGVLRHRLTAELGPDMPCRFLGLHDADPGAWGRFVDALESCADLDAAADAAVHTFAVYHSIFGQAR